jgi:hypothetical protein
MLNVMTMMMMRRRRRRRIMIDLFGQLGLKASSQDLGFQGSKGFKTFRVSGFLYGFQVSSLLGF